MNDSAHAVFAKDTPPRLADVEGARRRWGWLAFALGAMAVGVALFVFDPARQRFFPVCLFHAVTGLNCPGCGGTRAVHHLLHGELAAALRCNALVVLALPVGALTALWCALRPSARRAGAPRLGLWLPWLLLGLAAVFAVVRNLPAGAWLSP